MSEEGCITCTHNQEQSDHIDSRSTVDHKLIDSMSKAQVYHLSLCGCGFLGIYHLGAASCLIRHGRTFLKGVDRVVGASAGSLVASILVINHEKLKDCIKFTHNLATELKSKPFGALTPGYNLLKPLKKFLDQALPVDAHLRASGKLYISLTNVKTRKNEIFSQYNSREELLKCLLASSYIPLYAGVRPPKIRGKRYIDGGFTDNLPVFEDGETVRVSPFSGGQEISPADKRGLGLFLNMHSQDFQLNRRNLSRGLHALFPPSKDTLSKYYNRGFHDAERFLKSKNMFEPEQFTCSTTAAVTGVLSSTTTPTTVSSSRDSAGYASNKKPLRIVIWRETTV